MRMEQVFPAVVVMAMAVGRVVALALLATVPAAEGMAGMAEPDKMVTVSVERVVRLMEMPQPITLILDPAEDLQGAQVVPVAALSSSPSPVP